MSWGVAFVLQQLDFKIIGIFFYFPEFIKNITLKTKNLKLYLKAYFQISIHL